MRTPTPRSRRLLAASLCASLGLAAGGVGATPSSESPSFESPSFDDRYDEPERCSPDNPEACLNGASSPVANGAMMREALNSHGATTRDRTGTKREQGTATRWRREAWFAAGDGADAAIGTWVSYNYLDAESDFAQAGTPLGFESDSHNALAGVDRLFFEDRLLLGLAGGYSALSVDTVHNGGGVENDGFTIAPYAALLLNEVFGLDVSGGYSSLDYEQHRVSPTDGSLTTSAFDSGRWFIAGNVNATLARGNWLGNLRVGGAHVSERQDAYLETGSAASALGGTLRAVQERNIHLTQVIAAGEVAYSAGAVEPYFMVAYHNDVSRSDDPGAGGMPGQFRVVQPDDDDEVQLGFGLRCYTERGFTATLEYLRVEGREDFDMDSVLATLRLAL
jgi:hypothetical protein